MRCLICGKGFSIPRTIKTLFVLEKTFQCPSCQKKYKPYVTTQIIPKTNGVFEITSFFIEQLDLELEVFPKEIEAWLEVSIKNSLDNYLLWFDELDLKTIEMLDMINGDIHILAKKIFHI